MNWNLIALVVVLAFAALSALAFLSNRPDWLIWLLAAALALGNFNIYVFGTVVFPFKVVMLFGILWLGLRAPGAAVATIRTGGSGFGALFFCVSASVIMAYIIPPSQAEIESSGLQGTALRPLVQAYTYFSCLAIFPLVKLGLRPRNATTATGQAERFYRVYLGLALISAVVGLYQLFQLKRGGTFMPIIRAMGEEHSDVAGYEQSGAMIYRLYAFAGEPKALAIFLMPGLFAILAFKSYRAAGRRLFLANWPVVVVIGVVFVLTYSTSGLFAFCGGVLFFGLVLAGTREGSFLKFVGGCGLVLLAFGYVYYQIHAPTAALPIRNQPGALDALTQRLYGRMSEEYETRNEYRVLNYLLEEKPVGLLFGLGPGMYSFHLPDMTFGRGVNMVNSGWVTMLSDLGGIGTFVFVLWAYGLIKRAMTMRALLVRTQPWRASLLVVSVASFVASLFLHAGMNSMVSVFLFGSVTAVISNPSFRQDRIAPRQARKSRSRRREQGRGMRAAVPGSGVSDAFQPTAPRQNKSARDSFQSKRR